jgi:hypothetical protein
MPERSNGAVSKSALNAASFVTTALIDTAGYLAIRPIR